MSSLFGRPKEPKIPAQEEEIEPIETITEDTEVKKRRERKRLLKGGRTSTILSGITSALKKRLGE